LPHGHIWQIYRYVAMTEPTLTPTGWTILGFLSLRPRNGYQLRAAVQRSVGAFWGVSYGQLYPQLKALAQAGLIEETEQAGPAENGGRQTWWRLTETGSDALRQWLLEPAAPTQVRDEGLVKLLFSDHAGPEAMYHLIAERRERASRRKQVAEAIVPGAHWPAVDTPEGRSRQADLLAAWLVRAHAVAIADAELSWCATAEAMIDERRHSLEGRDES
jgi:PadR family transcriptional regulator, regulatory protein AphA